MAKRGEAFLLLVAATMIVCGLTSVGAVAGAAASANPAPTHMVWYRTQEIPGHDTEAVEQLVPSGDGRVYVIGRLDTNTTTQYVLEAYSANGQRLWSTMQVPSDPANIIVSPDANRIYVAGSAAVGDHGVFSLSQYNKKGSVVRTTVYRGHGSDEPVTSLTMSPNGRTFYLTGGYQFSVNIETITRFLRLADGQALGQSQQSGGH